MVLVNDGTSVVAEDIEKRKWLKANNYRYIVFSYKEGPEHKEKQAQLKDMIGKQVNLVKFLKEIQ